MSTPRPGDKMLTDWREAALRFEAEVAKAVVGQERVIRLVTLAVFGRGHVMLEGDVGVGKTTLLRAVARALGGAYERVEGTVDMMPTDLIYHTYLAEDGRPRVEPGPVLRESEDLSVFFFNEINRARPQVHALLLRLMAERSVQAFNREYRFPNLQVFADRNRVEREETFELPAAARDRFLMEIGMEAPREPEARRALVFDPRFHDTDRLIEEVAPGVLDHARIGSIAGAIQHAISAAPEIEAYVVALWEALLRPAAAGIRLPGIDMEALVQGGASPRGVAFLVRAARVRAWLEGREWLVPEDVRAVFPEVMAHRVFLEPVHEMRRAQIVPELCRAVFETVPTP
ncbi:MULTISPECIES: MoxR family ATPase [Methylobacterium]|uniref:Magnesium-chelatase 38 kDa subunit n=3 Tax=Pseudomonadota TaxID=1224 RepID=A0ABQ4SSB5_9HYPH|nr:MULTISPECIES: MoxR family ATPase [Methylobacterium]PIU06522.1 MAG: AAA family ATPase [Methylobacterium sp. CG09_land_8_20_14_0_10_71_15]PIU11090.1 MAG: AAA family ATPase [Methylobacterium sp. CG08_land_8_20_14_0_20_71_15]GBU16483.1 ATPase AAA [Methylobacterium sp.]GJE06090.1 Magnesium-chelatase 38 kDa subunit [Methylobacterium jeotgali]